MYYYDIVASIYNDYGRVDYYSIRGGFNTVKEAIEYINKHGIYEEDYYWYCNDDEAAYIEIEEHDARNRAVTAVISVD